MNRKDFLKRFGIGIGAVAIAPKVLAEVLKDDHERFAEKIEDIFNYEDELQTVWGTKTTNHKRRFPNRAGREEYERLKVRKTKQYQEDLIRLIING